MRTIIDDYGQLRIGRPSRSIEWAGRFNPERHVPVSEPMWFEDHDFWFVDAVYRDTPDQPVVAVVL